MQHIMTIIVSNTIIGEFTEIDNRILGCCPAKSLHINDILFLIIFGGWRSSMNRFIFFITKIKFSNVNVIRTKPSGKNSFSSKPWAGGCVYI